MMTELVERYRVHTVTAVLKAANRRSLRLLERLGFELASAEAHAERRVEQSEILMHRAI
jgi:RimJ/RimL family protein N-acetyltransferase